MPGTQDNSAPIHMRMLVHGIVSPPLTSIFTSGTRESVRLYANHVNERHGCAACDVAAGAQSHSSSLCTDAQLRLPTWLRMHACFFGMEMHFMVLLHHKREKLFLLLLDASISAPRNRHARNRYHFRNSCILNYRTFLSELFWFYMMRVCCVM